MTENEKLAELLLPNITKTPEDYEVLYPPRQLKRGGRRNKNCPQPNRLFTFRHLIYGAN